MKFTKSKKGKIYYDLYVRGYKEHKLAPNCTNELEAEEYKEKRRKIVELMIDGDIPPDKYVSKWLARKKTVTDIKLLKKGDIITVDLMCKNYENYHENRAKAKRKKVKSNIYTHPKFFREFFGKDTDISTIKKFQILSMRRFLKSNNKSRYNGEILSDTTINHYVMNLRRCFNLLREEELIIYNPCDNIKPLQQNNHRKIILPIELEDEFLSYLPPIQADMMLLDLNTGLRTGNLFNLNKSQIDLKNKIIKIKKTETKSQKDYEIPLNDIALEVIEKYYYNTENCIFINPDTGLPFRKITRSFKRAAKLIGIPDMYPHDIRRTFGTRVYRITKDIKMAQRLLCHADPKTTERYIVIDETEVSNTVDMLAEVKKNYYNNSNIINFGKKNEQITKVINNYK